MGNKKYLAYHINLCNGYKLDVSGLHYLFNSNNNAYLGYLGSELYLYSKYPITYNLIKRLARFFDASVSVINEYDYTRELYINKIG
jgi:hypothetical protein